MKLNLTRRRFLKQSAAAAGCLATGVWSESPAADSKSPNEPLQLGMIGVGNHGATNIGACQDERIIALCDVDRSYLDPLAERYPDATTYADFRELLQQSDLDAVVISTPDHTHFHAAALAMRAGLHVYCEKPLAHSIWEVRELERLSRQTGVATQIGTQHHATEGYRRAVEIVRAGVLGPIHEVHAWTNRPLWPQGLERPAEQQAVPQHLNWDLWLGPAPERPYHETYHPVGWRGWWDFGCGALGDMGPHLLDPVVWALELTRPTMISAAADPAPAESFPTSSTITFDFPARGSSPAVRLTWYDGDRQPPMAVTGAARLPANGVLFVGERAQLFAPDYGRPPIVRPHRRDDRLELPPPSLPVSPGQHQEWFAACRSGQPASCNFTYGALLTEICLLGNLAVRLGQPLHWDADRMSAAKGVERAKLVRPEYREGWKTL